MFVFRSGSPFGIQNFFKKKVHKGLEKVEAAGIIVAKNRRKGGLKNVCRTKGVAQEP